MPEDTGALNRLAQRETDKFLLEPDSGRESRKEFLRRGAVIGLGGEKR